jgi:hypothetical protein
LNRSGASGAGRRLTHCLKNEGFLDKPSKVSFPTVDRKKTAQNGGFCEAVGLSLMLFDIRQYFLKFFNKSSNGRHWFIVIIITILIQ